MSRNKSEAYSVCFLDGNYIHPTIEIKRFETLEEAKEHVMNELENEAKEKGFVYRKHVLKNGKTIAEDSPIQGSEETVATRELYISDSLHYHVIEGSGSDRIESIYSIVKTL